MPIAVNDSGETVYLTPEGQWAPARTAVNPETKETLAFDGSAWTPLPGPKKAEAAAEPDQYRATVRKEIDADRAKGLPLGSPSQRLIVQGMTLNAADDLMAGAVTPLEMIKRRTWNPAEAYRYAKAREDLMTEDARKETGILGTAAEVAGGVLSGSGLARAGITAGRFLAPNAGLLARTGAAAADGVGMGAAAGAMEGNSVGERTGNAAAGGLLGGIIGGGVTGALGVGGGLLSPIVSNIRARANPQGFANNQVARAVAESGQSPQNLAASVSQAASEGQPMFTLADAMGNAGQRMLSTVTRAPGAGRTNAVEFLEQRQAGQGRRVANQLAEGFDSPRTAEQTRTAMTGARDAASDTAYTAARDGAGPVDLSRTIAKIDETLTPGGNIFRPGNGIANDSIESALDGFRQRMTDGKSVMTDFTAIQRLRGEISDAVQKAVRAGEGNRARMLGQVLGELDTAMEGASTGFRAANRAHAQASRNIDAIDEGRAAATRGRSEDIVPAFRAKPVQGQEAYRAGYVDPLIEQAQGGAFGVNKARPLTSDAFGAESAAIAPMRTQPQMRRQIGRENTMFETRAAALGGSKTADNLADGAAMGIDPTIIGHILTGNVTGAAKSMLAAGSNLFTGNTPAVREAVGNILLQRGQGVTPQNIERVLDEAMKRIERAQQTARLLGGGGRASLGGLAVAPAATSELRR
jgi:hypothetical protein